MLIGFRSGNSQSLFRGCRKFREVYANANQDDPVFILFVRSSGFVRTMRCTIVQNRKDLFAEEEKGIKQRETEEGGVRGDRARSARGRGCGANRIPGDFRILGNELVRNLYTRTCRVHVAERLNVDKFKNGATGYRRNRPAREMFIADVAEEGGDEDDDVAADVRRRCRRRRPRSISFSVNAIFYSHRGKHNGIENKGGGELKRAWQTIGFAVLTMLKRDVEAPLWKMDTVNELLRRTATEKLVKAIRLRSAFDLSDVHQLSAEYRAVVPFCYRILVYIIFFSVNIVAIPSARQLTFPRF